MSGPQAPAPDVAIRARPPSPRRLNRKMLLAGACVVGGVIAAALVAGLGARRGESAATAQAGVAAGPPPSILDASGEYEAHDLAPPQADWARAEATREEEASEASFQRGSDPVDRGARAPENAQSVSEDPEARAAASAILFAKARTPLAATPPDANDAGRHGRFLQGQGESASRLGERVTPASSRYALLSGSIVPAALLTALNADLPGRVVAQVTAPVYDSVSGRHLLIPQGARLIGAYDSAVTHGDERVLLVWNRLVFPDGASIDLRGMEATDATGAAGLGDRTDRHLDRLAGAIGLSALFSVIANEAEGDERDRSLGQSIGDAAAQDAARAGARIVERDLAVKPTLRVRAGARVRLLVTRDIVLRPYGARSVP